MSREIKLRAWRKSINMFMDGFYTPYNCISLGVSEEDLVWMEFTGAFDKNGKEIFEGDIIKRANPRFLKGLSNGKANWVEETWYTYGTVEFFACSFRVAWPDQTDDDLAYLLTNELEVVGNIYENPALLSFLCAEKTEKSNSEPGTNT